METYTLKSSGIGDDRVEIWGHLGKGLSVLWLKVWAWEIGFHVES